MGDNKDTSCEGRDAKVVLAGTARGPTLWRKVVIVLIVVTICVLAVVARKRQSDPATPQPGIKTSFPVAADNPLDRALTSGKPTLADFGRGTCIPCKMMQPILDELEKELKGRVHVLVLDTRDYGDLARRHGVRIIPTQIFFDAAGKEMFRHEGFMSREEILAKLEELRIPLE